MWRIGERMVSMMVLCAVAIHLSWAYALALDPSALGATAIHAIYRFVPSRDGVAIVCCLVAMLALIGIFSRSSKTVIWLLIPQQIVLTFSAAGAIEAIYLGQYADGVLRPIGFIFGDQVSSIWMAFWHTMAIVAHAARLRKGWKSDGR